MNEELIKKIRELLSKHGVEDEKVELIVDELNEDATAGDPADGKPTDSANTEEKTTPQAPVENDGGKGDPVLPTDKPAPVDEPVGPAQVSPDAQTQAPDGTLVNPADFVNENAPVEPDEPPVANPNAPTPNEPASPDVELLTKIDEQAKTIDGLKARIESLVDALEQAGIINGTDNSFGVDKKPTAPANSDEGVELDEVIDRINRGSRF